jgi:WD40 repeat protein
MADPVNFEKSALAWTLPWDADWPTSVTFIGNTRRVAAGNNLGQIVVWDLPEQPGDPAPAPCRRLDGHTNVISRLVSTPDGRWLISASYDHTIRFWDMQAPAKGSEEIVLNARAIADAEARKRNGAKVPPAIPAKVETQEAQRVLDAHKDWILGLSMSKDGNTLASGDDAGQVIVWDRAEGKEVRRWKVKGWTYALALSADAQQLLISERVPLVFDSGRYGAVKLYDPNTGEMKRDLAALFKQEHMGTAAFSPDGKVLAIARTGEANGPAGKVTLVDPATGNKLRETNPGHIDGATDVAFHPDGEYLASAGRDTLVRIWKTADAKLVKELGKGRGGQFKDWIHAVSFSADGRWLAASDMAGQVLIYTL